LNKGGWVVEINSESCKTTSFSGGLRACYHTWRIESFNYQVFLSSDPPVARDTGTSDSTQYSHSTSYTLSMGQNTMFSLSASPSKKYKDETSTTTDWMTQPTDTEESGTTADYTGSTTATNELSSNDNNPLTFVT
jgi:hypothetical protein